MSTLRQFCLAFVSMGASVIILTVMHIKPSIFGGVLLLVIGGAGYVMTDLSSTPDRHDTESENKR